MVKAKVIEASTEEKIKDAARKVFLKKGYAATRTRDIAEEAGINLALLNYYFRSKEKLFEIIMQEKLIRFFGHLIPVIYDLNTTLDQKIETLADNYYQLLKDNQDLPIFVLGELRNRPDGFFKSIMGNAFLKNSVVFKQLAERRPDMAPEHFIMNMLGMCVFPFVMKPMLQAMADISDKKFDKIVLERKTFVPIWMNAMLSAK